MRGSSSKALEREQERNLEDLIEKKNEWETQTEDCQAYLSRKREAEKEAESNNGGALVVNRGSQGALLGSLAGPEGFFFAGTVGAFLGAKEHQDEKTDARPAREQEEERLNELNQHVEETRLGGPFVDF